MPLEWFVWNVEMEEKKSEKQKTQRLAKIRNIDDDLKR